jgi:PAS domain S-box-containing protein
MIEGSAKARSAEELSRENESLRLRLAMAEETLRALQVGEVDAVLVESGGDRVYTLESVDAPYELVVTQIQHPAVTLDPDGSVISCNQDFADLLGLPSGKLPGKPLSGFVPPESRSAFQSLLRDGAVAESHAEMLLQPESGAAVPVCLAVRPLRVGARGLCLVATEVSEQRQYQELRRIQDALRASEERLELSQRAGRIGSFEWNIETGAVTWSATKEELHGLPVGSFGGRFEDWTQAVHPDDRDRVEYERRRAAAGLIDLDTEYRIVRQDGQTRWLASKGRVFSSGERGQPMRMLGVSMDITERKRTQQELEGADRRKDEFLATLAHELRNPLAPMRNAIKILKAEGPSHPDLNWARDVLDRQIHVMARLLEDLLDVSRISRDSLKLRKEEVSLASVIDSALETSRSLIDAGGHRLTVELPPEPVHLEADPVRLAEVFSNLLDNAAKYTEPGGRIDLGAVRQGDDVVVSVKDSGVGIPSEMLTHIFEIFSQGKPVASSKSGLGIGLSLVKWLVEMHGGSVEARSQGPGRGSEFLVRLPVVEKESVRAAAARIEEEPESRGQHRILIADDNRDSADSLALYLRLKGHETTTAYDGEAAIAAAESIRPDVVLLDIGMPKLSGYEVCRRIREQPWGRGALVVALTGWGQKQDQQRSEEAGFDRHMVKPIEPSALVKLLASLPSGSGDNPRG